VTRSLARWLLALPLPASLALADLPPWEDLPAGPGRELTYGICSACHSMQIVRQQGLTRDAWADTLDWMTEEQGMAELSGPIRELVLDYLAIAFSPERPNYDPTDAQ
jgi:cytochrome c